MAERLAWQADFAALCSDHVLSDSGQVDLTVHPSEAGSGSSDIPVRRSPFRPSAAESSWLLAGQQFGAFPLPRCSTDRDEGPRRLAQGIRLVALRPHGTSSSQPHNADRSSWQTILAIGL